MQRKRLEARDEGGEDQRERDTERREARAARARREAEDREDQDEDDGLRREIMALANFPCGRSSTVEHQVSTLGTRVRLPSPAF